MALAKFVFGLQPKLDQALEQKKRAEGLLGEAVARRTESVRALETAESKLEEVTQQLRAARDYLSAVSISEGDADSGLAVIEGGRYAAAIEAVRGTRERELSNANEALGECDRMVSLRRHELAEAMRGVETFEKLRDRQYEEYKIEVSRSEEMQRDDTTILSWNQRRSSGERGNEG